MEDKQKICDLLTATMPATYNACDLMSLIYDGEKETVTATFNGGGKYVINVALDSGTSMIRDIIKRM